MLDINTSETEGIFMIHVVGEVDAESSITLDNELKKAYEADRKKIIVDLSRLTYISSAGLGVFIAYIEDFKSKDIKVVLCSLKEEVFEIFEVLGIHQLMTITDSKEKAIQILNA